MEVVVVAAAAVLVVVAQKINNMIGNHINHETI
jgi:hypothetical protein